MKCTKVADRVQWQWRITRGDCVISVVTAGGFFPGRQFAEHGFLMSHPPTYAVHFAYTAITMVAALPFISFALEVFYETYNTMLIQTIRTGLCWLCAGMIWQGSTLFRIGTAAVAMISSGLMSLSLLLTSFLGSIGVLHSITGWMTVTYIFTVGILLLLPPVARYQEMRRNRRRNHAMDAEPPTRRLSNG